VVIDASSLLDEERRLLGLWEDVWYALRLVVKAVQMACLASPLVVLVPLARLSVWVEDVSWRYVYWAVERCGPCYIKFMQWAATRPDLFPADICQRCARFHCSVAPHSLRATEYVLTHAFGPSWRESLEIVDKEPIGSGCVAQVYRGRLRQQHSSDSGSDGWVDVAVKVAHPGIAERIQLDLQLMRAGASLLEVFPSIRWLALRDSVEQFASVMSRQADLSEEAEHITRFRQLFPQSSHDRDTVVFPEVVDGRWVHPEVLVERFEDGTRIGEWIDQQNQHDDTALRKRVANLGISAFLKMLFIDNFVHADLHPGNLLIRIEDRPDGKSPPRIVLVFLDCGLVTELQPRDRRNFVSLFRALAKGDGQLAGRLILREAKQQRCPDPQAFVDEVDTLLNTFLKQGVQLSQVRAGEILSRLLTLASRHRVQLEGNFVSVCLAVMILEGLGRQLDPHIDLLKAAAPYVMRAALTLGIRDQ